MQSPSYQAFHQIVQYAKRGSLAPDFGEHGCTALEEPQTIARVLYHRLRTRFRPLAVQSIRVDMQGEQSPNPASRVTLCDDVDALGMRRAVLDWQIDPLDSSNLYKTAMELARSVGAAGLGRMVVNLEPGDELSKILTCWHHMGTTRMHDDPRQGVVDRHCAVHGLANFYIAGSSVFPTGGRANPTITIVALAIRLADHLKLTVNSHEQVDAEIAGFRNCSSCCSGTCIRRWQVVVPDQHRPARSNPQLVSLDGDVHGCRRGGRARVNDICAKPLQPRSARLSDCKRTSGCDAPQRQGVRSKQCRLHSRHAVMIFAPAAFIASMAGCWRRPSSTWRRYSRSHRIEKK